MRQFGGLTARQWLSKSLNEKVGIVWNEDPVLSLRGVGISCEREIINVMDLEATYIVDEEEWKWWLRKLVKVWKSATI